MNYSDLPAEDRQEAWSHVGTAFQAHIDAIIFSLESMASGLSSPAAKTEVANTLKAFRGLGAATEVLFSVVDVYVIDETERSAEWDAVRVALKVVAALGTGVAVAGAAAAIGFSSPIALGTVVIVGSAGVGYATDEITNYILDAMEKNLPISFTGINADPIEYIESNGFTKIIGNALDNTFFLESSGLLIGGAGDDELYGSHEVDLLEGGVGHDWIEGRGGADEMWGDAGNDTVVGGDDADQIHGGTDDDVLRGAGGNDQIWGDSGNDVIYGDEQFGAPGDDTIHGGLGNDTLYDGGGSDQISGDAGDDVIYDDSALVGPKSGGDVVDGGPGSDTVHYDGDGGGVLAPGGITIELDPFNREGDEQLGIRIGSELQEGKDYVTSVETIAGTDYSDTVLLYSSFYLNKGDYDDTIKLDLMDADSEIGNVVNGSYSDSPILYRSGRLGDGGLTVFDVDTFIGSKYNDLIDRSAEESSRSAGRRMTYGGDGRDTLIGGDQDDWLDGGSEANVLSGGAGNDVFVISSEGNVIRDAESGDRLFFRIPDPKESEADMLVPLLGGVAYHDGGAPAPSLELSSFFSAAFYTTIPPYEVLLNGNILSYEFVNMWGDHDYISVWYYVNNRNDMEVTVWLGDNPTEVDDGEIICDVTISNIEPGDLGFEFDSGLRLPPIDRVPEWGYGGEQTAREAFDRFFNDANFEEMDTWESVAERCGGDGSQELPPNGGGSAGDDVLQGTDEDEFIHGESGNDILYGAAGDDVLWGGVGSDTYAFGGADGADTISEQSIEGDRDVVFFGPDINPEDVVVARLGAAHGNAGLTFSGSSIVLTNQFSSEEGCIEEFRFLDGTIWDAADLRRSYLDQQSTAGDDLIEGFFSDDTIEGGEGADTLSGGAGADAFVFNAHDGADLISDFDVGSDVLLLRNLSGLASFSDVLSLATEVEGSTQLDFGEEGSIELQGVALASLHAANFAFETSGTDAGEWLSGTSGDDLIYGRGGDDEINGQPGNDTIYGGDGNDTIGGSDGDDRLDGGAGDDEVDGSTGSDVFVYGLGSGNDTIIDWGPMSDVDAVEFGPGIDPDEIAIERGSADTQDAKLVMADGQALEIIGQFYADGHQIEEFRFDDGTIWDAADLRQTYLDRHSTAGDDFIEGFLFDDTINGGSGADTIEGGEGADTLSGGAGADAFVFNAHDGADLISDFDVGSDVLLLRNLSGLASFSDVLSLATEVEGSTQLDFGEEGSIELQGVALASLHAANFAFETSGTDAGEWLSGTSGDDLIYGRGGDDEINGQPGNDTIYGGDGNDTIGGSDGDDRLDGGAGDDEVDGSTGSDVFVYGLGSGNDTIIDWGPMSDVDAVEFGPGIDPDEIAIERGSADTQDAKLVMADGQALEIIGQFYADGHQIEEFRFDDGTIWDAADLRQTYLDRHSTAGDDFIEGFLFDDTINGGSGADTIEGGEGADTLSGGAGADAFVFNAHDGADLISDFDVGSDVLLLRNLSGLASFSDVLSLATEVEGSTQLDFGEEGSIELQGVALASLHAANFAFETSGTDAGEWLSGTSGDDVIYGRGGDDEINGQPGNDTIYGGDGNDTIGGSDGDDRLDGGAGDDEVDGSTGSDVFVYGLGSGNDTIIDWGPMSDVDAVEFGPGIDPDEIAIERGSADTQDAKLVMADGQTLEIIGQFYADGHQIEEFRFDDGTIWDAVDLRQIYLDQHSTAGDDLIEGFLTDDTINGGSGADTLSGSGGSDRFVFGPSFGQDIILDFNPTGPGHDVIEFDATLISSYEALQTVSTHEGDGIRIATDSGNTLLIMGLDLDAMSEECFVFA
ncbi:hypothetical protein L0F51_09625 [Afifella sp. H1R]|uniref:calcium-binding protein n=1 Tax=Afifella sp. H1R TaxID=2908841 RepID=UPI001F3C9039|nr:calcium-binding protein [Afifella sp. H1R]MCF1504021.1 hypothetical protein [Afifella sp. H1R]